MYMGTCVCALVYISIGMHGLFIYICIYAFMYEPLLGINEVAFPASGGVVWPLHRLFQPIYQKYIQSKIYSKSN